MHRLPNILSGVRIVLAPVFLFLFFQDDFVMKAIGLGVYIVAAITDYYDGYFARKYKVFSDFGAFLDPLADKFLTFSGFIVLPFIALDQFPWWAIALIIVRDTVITVLRVYMKRKKVTMETRFTAKIKTTIQLFTISLYLFGLAMNNMLIVVIADIMLFISLLITVYTGYQYTLSTFKK